MGLAGAPGVPNSAAWLVVLAGLSRARRGGRRAALSSRRFTRRGGRRGLGAVGAHRLRLVPGGGALPDEGASAAYSRFKYAVYSLLA